MRLHVAGSLFALSLLLIGCGAQESETPPAKALRVAVNNVAWAAYQDGDGFWQRLPEHAATSRAGTAHITSAQVARLRPYSTRGMRQTPRPRAVTSHLGTLQAREYTLTITDAQGRYGLSYVCLDDGEAYAYSDLIIELSSLMADPETSITCYSGEAEPTHILSGTVRGLGATDLGVVEAGFFDETSVDAANTTYSFELWPDIYDVIATRYSVSDTVPNRIIIQTDITLDADRTLDLDFEDELAFTPETYVATITDVADGLTPSGGVAVASKNFTIASLGGVMQGPTFDYAAIPAEQLGSEAFLYAYASGSDGAGSHVEVQRDLLTAVDITLPLPEPLSGASVTAVQGPTRYRFPTATWNAYPGEGIIYDIYYSQYSENGSSPSVTVLVDQNRLETAATLTYTLPDLSAVPGWNSTWNLQASEEMNWSIGASLERNTTAESADYIYVDHSGEIQ